MLGALSPFSKSKGVVVLSLVALVVGSGATSPSALSAQRSAVAAGTMPPKAAISMQSRQALSNGALKAVTRHPAPVNVRPSRQGCPAPAISGQRRKRTTRSTSPNPGICKQRVPAQTLHHTAGSVRRAGSSPHVQTNQAGPTNPIIVNGWAGATISSGGTEPLTAIVTSQGLIQNAIIDFEVYNAGSVQVWQYFKTGVTLNALAAAKLHAFWKVPATQPSGTYTFKIGVFGPGWTPEYVWDNQAATFQVTGQGSPTNTPSVPTATATNTPAAPSATPTSTRQASTPTPTSTTPPATATHAATTTPTATATFMATGTSTPTGGPTAVSTAIPVPTELTLEQDDRAAVLSWNGPLNVGWPDPHGNPTGVSGYKITWGPIGQPMTNTALTEYRIIELQPLVNGQQYQAEVQALDEYGNLSVPSALVNFTGDPTRVNTLRQQMTGFFDDFNIPQGPVDEVKWNSAYSQCDNSTMTGIFVNGQSHVHNMIDDLNCDRGQNVERPRALFDFTGRTGTITFDMDGTQRRDQWYLDLVPNLMDIDGQISIEGGGQNGPGNVLRFHQTDTAVSIFWIDSTGTESQSLCQSGQGDMSFLNILPVPNVRRHWALHVSQTHADITVNGVTVCSTDSLSLPFSKAYLLWNQFSYNTPKSNEPDALLHWDNFGFDGPAPTTETHNYLDTNYFGGGDYAAIQASNNGGIYTTTIQIPDSLSGASAQRIMFSMQMSGNQWYSWDPGDAVTVNGHTIAIPQPNDAPLDQTILVSTIEPYAESFSLPAGTLHTGTNTVAFHMKSSGVLNVHAEVDFPAGQAPAYTQPAQIQQMPDLEGMMGDVGPGATLTSINGQGIYISGTLSQQPASLFTANGTVQLGISVDNEVAMNAIGKAPGIAQVEVTVDGQPIFVQDTTGQGHGAPAPSFQGTISLNTTKYANGLHTLRVLAVNPNGTPSIPDYFSANTSQGQDWPIGFTVQN